MPRPRTHDEALRAKLLTRASELLGARGASALSLRKLAAEAGTSTTAVYSLFGGKSDLVNALYADGFRRFGERLRAVEASGDVVRDLVALGLGYRDGALSDPHLYSAMFSGAVPGFEPNGTTSALARNALEPLWDTARAGIESGVFSAETPGLVAVNCWGCAHGLVSLELNTSLSSGVDFRGTYERALSATVRGWLA
ncbi:TetR family transcriptional regulator [Prauserella marina]|uniref:DNA-binding transcriptional regulator, AcrR family n=1 Tax=Prauserella marina TaxID=530584 RepID=A0A222VKI5_9PSEU|nr:TetR/AcrR family transcriptional regulator [Prauserella marina]ASR34221.1 TetR family transcriptional regulator [Prauserella marina]PWV70903.1 TetR family transcriptional regulator [Prauserella marina]SDE01412.1 DNA-binding transcriptional regulator, AcrR family [Prauserella marina]